jgi:hypothetical protein
VVVVHKQRFLLQLFINNQFVDSASGKTFPTLNPANEKKIADIAEADKVDSLNFNIHFLIIMITYTASKNKMKQNHYICVFL